MRICVQCMGINEPMSMAPEIPNSNSEIPSGTIKVPNSTSEVLPQYQRGYLRGNPRVLRMVPSDITVTVNCTFGYIVSVLYFKFAS